MMNSTTYETDYEVLRLPIDKISVNPYQPRRFFESSQLDDLAASIRQYGVLQPISVRLIGSSYELVAGERRLRASRMARLDTIPAIVVNISDQESALIAVIENLQRQDLNFLEEAEAFTNMINDYGFTQEQLAARVGKKQSTVANKLRILKLPRLIRESLLEFGLTERHARALLKLPTAQSQMEAMRKIAEKSLNVKNTEDMIEKMLQSGAETAEKKRPSVRPVVKDMRLFTNTVKQALDVMNRSGLKTSYEVEENKDGCFISIMVAY
jgi:ParB family chromosome partitioning protein